ncbi:MAG: HAD family phosphatase [Erysipelotrichaceae bacterium]|nr:HAD family phosphatase [Erysipelotrichaceae bacterium]
MIKGIIFDCDGVLLDSEPLFTKAMDIMVEAYGFDLDLSLLPDANGTTVEYFCRIVLDLYPQIDVPLKKLVKDYYYYSDLLLMSDDLKPMEGIRDFCREQYEKGRQLSVASSSPAYYVRHKLKLFKIEPYFTYIVTADDITHSKPHPEIYQKAIERSGFDQDELIVIEDAPNGIAAAKAAGLYVVGFKGAKIIQDTSRADEEVCRFTDIQILKKGN